MQQRISANRRLPARLSILALIALIFISVPAIPASGASSGLEHFKKVQSYADGMFTDVAASGWYADNVRNVYEYGIMNGVSAAAFSPQSDVTLAQALVMAARVRSVYENDAATFVSQPGEKWYMPYIRYAVMKGIVRINDFLGTYDRPATREQLAHIYAGTLPASEYRKINSIAALPDVNDKSAYFQNIIKLYDAGILSGSDKYGSFHPYDEISRAEAAAILSRLFLPELRKRLDLVPFDGVVESGVKECVFKWDYPEGAIEWTYSLGIPHDAYELYRSIDRDMLSYSFFVTQTTDDDYLAALADEFRAAAREKAFSDWETVHLVVRFVQSLDYIEEDGFDEYPKFPVETLYDQGGDCEDTSILLASLLRELKYGTVLIAFDDHMGVGIKGAEDLSGYYWTYDGGNYFFIETTATGFSVGDLPEAYRNRAAEVLPL